MYSSPRRVMFAVAIALTTLSACSTEPTDTVPEVEPPVEQAPAAASAGVDPAVADPDHYTVELDNDRVRVLRIRYGAGESSVMHHHPEGVAVFLTDFHGQMELPDGSTEEMEATAGEHAWTPAGEHLPTNLADGPLEVIQIELKEGAGSSDSAESGPDPTVVDPDHYTSEFENDRVRVLRIRYGVGETSVMHHHPDGVAIFLTDHAVSFELPDGSTEEVTGKAGDVELAPGGSHLPTNVSSQPVEVILVELEDS